jgi:putative ABC transport system permease protein
VTRHYLKLIWNRKRTNLLVMIEIFFSFLVVFGVAALAAYYVNYYRQPLGFSIEDVWAVGVATTYQRSPGRKTTIDSLAETQRQLYLAVKEFPEVRAVAGAFTVPYGHSQWISDVTVAGRSIPYGVNAVTDGFAEVFGLNVVQGRWFSGEDTGAAWTPVVINERLARAFFGASNPVGRIVPQDTPREGETQKEMRVVGVITDFRQDGELAEPGNYLFERRRPDDPRAEEPLGTLAIKVRPGTTAAFEERLVKRMQAVARDWSFEVRAVDDMRADTLRETLAPLAAGAVIAGFLMLMVAMGLTGVLWQTVTQRTKEIGLRRAKGATIPNIRTQILGELVMMTTLAVLLGTVVVVQFPLLRVFGFVSGGVYAASLVISALCIYLLTVVCAWYPSRMATRIQPAEALHYE